MNKKQIAVLCVGICAILALIVFPPWKGKMYYPYRSLTFLHGNYSYDNWYKNILWEGAGKRNYVGFHFLFGEKKPIKTKQALEYEETVKNTYNECKQIIDSQTQSEYLAAVEYPQLYQDILPFRDNPECNRIKLTGINHTYQTALCLMVVLLTSTLIFFFKEGNVKSQYGASSSALASQ